MANTLRRGAMCWHSTVGAVEIDDEVLRFAGFAALAACSGFCPDRFNAMKSSFGFHEVMSTPLRVIDPGQLLARRPEAGLTREQLASRIGVSLRMIFFL